MPTKTKTGSAPPPPGSETILPLSESYRCSKTSDFSELSMDKMKRLMNQVREYWYMGSILARSAMEKNNTAEWVAMGV